jgi:hypothetical protein
VGVAGGGVVVGLHPAVRTNNSRTIKPMDFERFITSSPEMSLHYSTLGIRNQVSYFRVLHQWNPELVWGTPAD